ncbi:MAG: hypothetical protein LBI61_02420 [Puniceicoccales bacterium]|jgi:hypothetical protein|nr:hypothetical protein [Puniceicoccales bacterium]
MNTENETKSLNTSAVYLERFNATTEEKKQILSRMVRREFFVKNPNDSRIRVRIDRVGAKNLENMACALGFEHNTAVICNTLRESGLEVIRILRELILVRVPSQVPGQEINRYKRVEMALLEVLKEMDDSIKIASATVIGLIDEYEKENEALSDEEHAKMPPELEEKIKNPAADRDRANEVYHNIIEERLFPNLHILTELETKNGGMDPFAGISAESIKEEIDKLEAEKMKINGKRSSEKLGDVIGNLQKIANEKLSEAGISIADGESKKDPVQIEKAEKIITGVLTKFTDEIAEEIRHLEEIEKRLTALIALREFWQNYASLGMNASNPAAV